MPESTKFPHAVDCYRLVARNGLPPHPEDTPVDTMLVYSEEEVEEAKKQLIEKHPGGWLVARPLD